MASTMLARKSCQAMTARVTRPSRSLRAVVVRATAEKPETTTPGADVTPIEMSSVNVAAAAPAAPAAAAPAPVSFGDAMAFAGPGPELINGRLAMIGVLAAIGAELGSGESVLTQFQGATGVVLATWALISVASLVPMFRGASPNEAFGPLTPKAERLNGQFAMIGIAALLLIEVIKGSALF